MSSTPSTIKSHCLYCGNNPVNHRATYISEIMMRLGSPLDRFTNIVNKPFLYGAIHNTITTWWVQLLELVHIVRFTRDITKACSTRSQVIWEEALSRGLLMEQMTVFKKPIEQYRVYREGRWHYFGSIPLPPKSERQAYGWMDNKMKLKQYLMQHGVRVPNGGSASTVAEAKKIFDRIEKPVIIKPENGSRGRHTVTNLSLESDMVHGFTIAKQLSYNVVVEEHLVGSVYRGTYVGGEIVGVLRGDPPRITGDGVSTIAALIEQKNLHKPARVANVIVTPIIEEFLGRQGYTLQTILPSGKTIDLREKIGLSYGGDAVEDFTITHPKLLQELKKAGDVLGVPVIGFDFISEDVTKNPDEVRWGIIEANSVPFIDLHHDPREGTPINVAAKVWDLWDVKG